MLLSLLNCFVCEMILQTHVRVSSPVFAGLRFRHPARISKNRLKIHRTTAKRDDDLPSEVMESDVEFLLKGALLTVTRMFLTYH